MKTRHFLYAALGFVLAACSSSAKSGGNDSSTVAQGEKSEKSAVVYFSATGTTRNAAEILAKETGSELIEIQPEQPYSDADLNWKDEKSRSSVEMKDSTSRPAIKKIDANLSDVKTVYIGFPIWWNLAPTVVNTFIESVDLKGKTIIPFATSGGDDITNSADALKKQYPDLDWGKGLLLNNATPESVKTSLKAE